MAESFFHNLNGFNNGVVLSDQNKFDFLSYENKKIFEFSSFIGLGMYGFKKIYEEYNNPACTCTEFNLINLFGKNSREKIIVNHSYPIQEERIELLLSWYKDGYLKAYNMPLQSELGVIYDYLPMDKKSELLKLFTDYCIRHSFFEGFATQNCLFAIGYIQAFLLKAKKELSILSHLGINTKEPIKKVIPKGNKKSSIAKNTTKGKIEIGDETKLADIISIWSLLITEVTGLYSPIKTKEELNFLLGHFFFFENAELPNQNPFDLNLFGKGQRHIIDFLMRLSSKINNDKKLENKNYCLLLKNTFKELFYGKNTTIIGISKNWGNKNKLIMEKIHNEININGSIYETFKRVLRKVDLYNLIPELPKSK